MSNEPSPLLRGSGRGGLVSSSKGAHLFTSKVHPVSTTVRQGMGYQATRCPEGWNYHHLP